MITYLKGEYHKSKKNIKKYEVVSNIFKTVDTFVILATTSTSVTVSVTGFGLIVIPIQLALFRG